MTIRSRSVHYVHTVRAIARRILFVLRHREQALPRQPLCAGQTGTPIVLRPEKTQRIIRTVARSVGTRGVLWRDGESTLIVHTHRVATQVSRGVILIRIPVHCEETGDAIVTVPFAVGDDRTPAGMVAATESRPRGPAQVIDVWGEALLAFAWHLLTSAAEGVAAESGRDEHGDELVPAMLSASADGLSILPMASHELTKEVEARVTRARPVRPSSVRAPKLTGDPS